MNRTASKVKHCFLGQFEKLVAEEKSLVDELQKYFNENVQSKDGYALNDNLEWVETPKPE